MKQYALLCIACCLISSLTTILIKVDGNEIWWIICIAFLELICIIIIIFKDEK